LLVIYKLIFDRINLSVCLSERTNEWKIYTTQFEIQQCSNLKTIVYAFNMKYIYIISGTDNDICPKRLILAGEPVFIFDVMVTCRAY
jgi:hypothetical protein